MINECKFLDQSKILPFPKVTPIQLPEVLVAVKRYTRFYDDGLDLLQLEKVFRDWYQPLIDINYFPYMYFMNNGITQALEYCAIHFKNIDIKMLAGDYFWLKTNNCASEVLGPIPCEVSYDTNPSAIDGSVHQRSWPSSMHILDGAYVGTSLDKILIPDNTELLLLSFSKNLGLPDMRCGLLLSKNKIPTLHVFQKTFQYVGLHTFNSIAKICNEIDIVTLASNLKKYQLEFCKYFEDFTPSQCSLLATTQNEKYKFYKRPNGIIRIPLGESITRWIQTQNTVL